MIALPDREPQVGNRAGAKPHPVRFSPAFFTGKIMDSVAATTFKARYRVLLAIRMSPGMFYLDFVIYPVLILEFLLLTFTAAPPRTALFWAGVVLSGYVAWTLLEYGLHRLSCIICRGLKPSTMRTTMRQRT